MNSSSLSYQRTPLQRALDKICETMAYLGKKLASDLLISKSSKVLRLNEDSISDYLLLQLIKAHHPHDLFVYRFNKRKEAKEGADWLIGFLSEGASKKQTIIVWVRVQAKVGEQKDGTVTISAFDEKQHKVIKGRGGFYSIYLAKPMDNTSLCDLCGPDCRGMTQAVAEELASGMNTLVQVVRSLVNKRVASPYWLPKSWIQVVMTVEAAAEAIRAAAEAIRAAEEAAWAARTATRAAWAAEEAAWAAEEAAWAAEKAARAAEEAARSARAARAARAAWAAWAAEEATWAAEEAARAAKEAARAAEEAARAARTATRAARAARTATRAARAAWAAWAAEEAARAAKEAARAATRAAEEAARAAKEVAWVVGTTAEKLASSFAQLWDSYGCWIVSPAVVNSKNIPAGPFLPWHTLPYLAMAVLSTQTAAQPCWVQPKRISVNRKSGSGERPSSLLQKLNIKVLNLDPKELKEYLIVDINISDRSQDAGEAEATVTVESFDQDGNPSGGGQAGAERLPPEDLPDYVLIFLLPPAEPEVERRE